MRRVLALGFLLLLACVALAMSHAEPRRSGSNGAIASTLLATAAPGDRFCQPREVLPAGTTALHPALTTGSAHGPRLLVTLVRRGRVLARVHAARGWADKALMVQIPRTSRDYDDVDVCFTVGPSESVTLIGDATPPLAGQVTLRGTRVGGTLRIDYYRPGRESWWSLAGVVVRRLGRGHGSWGGSWLAGAILALIVASWVLAARVVLRTIARDHDEHGVRASAAPARALRRIPTTAWAVGVIAILNAAAWSLLTPAFLVPDEISHVAYVQVVGELGRPPIPTPAAVFSPELNTTLAVVRSGTTRVTVYRAKVWTALEEQRLEHALSLPLSPRGNGDAGAVDPEPPLYYAVEAVPYRIAHGATLLTRLALMRLLSALMAGATALFAYLFLRECLPGRRWAWSVGGLAVAFTPMLGYVSGGVNPDSLLFAISAALFLCLARAFRLGMTSRIASWIGVVLALGMLAKINFYGLVPGALVAVALAARKSTGSWNRRVAELTGITLAVSLVPLALITALDAIVWERPFILAHSAADAHGPRRELGGQLSYLWQVYLPRLPGMQLETREYLGYSRWFKTFVGTFGGNWIMYPDWLYRVALGISTIVGALAVRTLVIEWAQVRRRATELLGYGMVLASLLFLIAMVGLRGWAPGVNAAAQGRYLMPLLALLGAVFALAACGAGARWGRVAGTSIVVIAIGWSLSGQLATLAGFYA